MKRRIVLTLFAAALVSPVMANAKVTSATMYKNPGCECCDGHAAALKRAGFDVKVVPTEKLAALKAKAGVPAELQGCHTMMVGGYAVEGHVPVAAVKRLLAEKPAVRGIALPGMPAGSPGMGGPKTAPFRVMSFEGDGTKLYMVE
ncbi:DUF411 domain-containing protein [Sphingomonas floccifaciens]|uniref:DUF411 domain-containing protein n=1 Tax=Sphingomonas floccifaciens TaxID=1844115 RepID=A0ABW4NEN6_9SPHN